MAATAIPAIFTNYRVDKPRAGLWGLSLADLFHVNNSIPHEQVGHRAFLKTDPLIDGARWSPSRILGKGGFGLVGLWQLKDQNGVVQDEQVIKEWAYDSELEVSGKRGLSKEAVAQYQMNQRGNEHAPILRNFKFAEDQSFRYNSEWRTYSEFCPNGDLDRLVTRYKAWGKYLPETFLWHVFHSLAKAAHEMSRGPWINYEDMIAFGDRCFMLHLDLKPPNVLIGKSRRQQEMEESRSEGNNSLDKRRRLKDDGNSAQVTLPDHFPAIKVHDFGLAEITAVDDDDNPMQYFSSGTPAYKPPEQRHYAIESPRHVNYPRRPWKPAVDLDNVVVEPIRPKGYTSGPRIDQPVPMNRVRNYDDAFSESGAEAAHVGDKAAADASATQAGLKFDPKFNTWCVGKIMYDLMTHAHWNHLDSMLDLLDETEHQVLAGDWEEGNDGPVEGNIADYTVVGDGSLEDDFLTTAEQDLEAGPDGPSKDAMRESLRVNEIYDQELVLLVRWCLNIRMSRRPPPRQMLRLTREGLVNSRARASDDEDALSQRVFYRDNEINQMPPGAHPFQYRPGNFNSVIEAKYWDVSWPRLRPPRTYLQLAWTLERADWEPTFPHGGDEILRDGLVYPRIPPSRAEYMNMTRWQLGEEIVHRYGNPAAIPRLKADCVDILEEMDEAGNYGNGAHLRQRPPPAPPPPSPPHSPRRLRNHPARRQQ